MENFQFPVFSNQIFTANKKTGGRLPGFAADGRRRVCLVRYVPSGSGVAAAPKLRFQKRHPRVYAPQEY
ncbi:TPA: hypothetical protein ACFP4Y_000385 [Neisseria bacilliformis]|uniref:hypothetical protein n=1 Tax=Neisseria bacilliformis TaxID=267212 RepID=UPI0006657E05|nr:hypothetical protein [Neisseria bacilliformis]